MAVRIQSLGGFSVLRDGELVRVSEWQSKRARELLKLLIARRGRPATRGYLMETLWPGEDPDRVANRLSVALTTVRGVLDPQRRFPPEHFVIADKDAVALNLDAVDVDMERFLSATADGLDRLRRGDVARGLPILSTRRRRLRRRLPRGEPLRRLGGRRCVRRLAPPTCRRCASWPGTPPTPTPP